MENQGTKRVGPLWVLIIIIIVLGIVYLAFRPTQQADAPTVGDAEVATTTIDTAVDTTTVPSETSATVAVPPPTVETPTAPTTGTGVQVIQGDGFTATVRPVTGEQPEIESFSMRQEPGESCIFSWEANKATSCDVTNVTMKTVVRGVPTKGSLQTDEPGTYQLTCKASGGKTATSDTVVCK